MTSLERPRTIVGNRKMNLGGDQALEWTKRLLSQVEVTADTAQLAVLPPFTAIHHFRAMRESGEHIPYRAGASLDPDELAAIWRFA
jgi:triosephosphate isomerase